MNKIKFIAIIFCFCFVHFDVLSQVKIGTNTTNIQGGSLLELETNGTKAGLKIAEVALTDALDVTTLPVQETSKGTLVWNTATSGQFPNTVSPGFYLWMGTKWEKVLSSASGNTKNIYDGDGKLITNRTLDMDVYSLALNSSATSGTSQFSIDGGTFNVNTVNNRIGIGNSNPNATLDIQGNPTEASVPDGVIVPKITRAQLSAKSVYGVNHTGTMLFVTEVNGTVTPQTLNITTPGMYFFDGNTWQKVIQDKVANSFMFVRATSQQPNMTLNSHVRFHVIDSQAGADISFNSTSMVFTLKAGKTYKLTGIIPWGQDLWAQWAWYNITSNSEFGSRGHLEPSNANNTASGTGVAVAYITPTVDTQVALRIVNQGVSGGTDVGDHFSGGAQASATIETIGSVMPSIPAAGSYKQTLYARRITSNQAVAANQDIVLNSSTGNIPYDTTTGVISLTAGVEYSFFVDLSVSSITNGVAQYALVDALTNASLSPLTEIVSSNNTGTISSANLVFSYTPTTNQNVKLRCLVNSFTIRFDVSSSLRVVAEGTNNSQQFIGMLTNEYNILNTYPSGAIVVKDGLLYQANSTIAAGTPFAVGTSGVTFKSLTKTIEVEALVNNLIPFTSSGLNIRYNDTNKQFEWMLPTVKYVKRISTFSSAASFSQFGGGTGLNVANEWNNLWTDNSLNLQTADQENMTIRIADNQQAMSTGNYEEYEIIATVGVGGNNNHIRITKKR